MHAKQQIGIINAVNKRKQNEIPSKPKDKDKLYSGITGKLKTNWKPSLEWSKWYKRIQHIKKKDIEPMTETIRIWSSACRGIKEINAVQPNNHNITNNNGIVDMEYVIEMISLNYLINKW